MKPSTVALALFFTGCALTLTIWLTQGTRDIAALPSVVPAAPTEEPGPKVSPTGPYPKAVVAEKEFDFGALQHMAESQHTFIVKNEGEAPLEVVAIPGESSCQCTLGEVEKGDAVPPGGERSVTLKWTIKNPAPLFRQWAKIRTNDPANKTIELVIHGRVEKEVDISPEGIWEAGEVLSDAGATVKGGVYSALLDAFEIEKVECENAAITAAWEPAAPEKLTERKAKVGYELTMKIGPNVPIGPIDEAVTVHLTGDHKVGFRVRGKRHGPIEVVGSGWITSSSTLSLREFPADKGKESTLFVYARDFDGTLELKGVKQNKGHAEFSLEPDPKFEGKSKRYILRVKVPAGSPSNYRRDDAATVDLEFNHPVAPNFRFLLDYMSL